MNATAKYILSRPQTMPIENITMTCTSSDRSAREVMVQGSIAHLERTVEDHGAARLSKRGFTISVSPVETPTYCIVQL